MSTLQVNTISESTSASGVTIDGVLIKDGLVDGKDVSALTAGKVLQVVQGTDNTPANITSSSYQDTGLTASITPSATSSKVLVIVSHSAFTWAPGAIPFAYIQLLRDSTVISEDFPLGIKAYLHGDGNGYIGSSQNISILDSPSSTSSLTYKTQGKYAGSGSGYLTTAYSDATESIVLMEIGG